jgi:glutathione S-transferase
MMLQFWRRARVLDEINRRLARLEAILAPASRCPECGHPVISAPFCDGEEYTCPDCALKFKWTLKDGRYVLEE